MSVSLVANFHATASVCAPKQISISGPNFTAVGGMGVSAGVLFDNVDRTIVEGYHCGVLTDDIAITAMSIRDSTGASHRITMSSSVDLDGCLPSSATGTASDNTGYSLQVTVVGRQFITTMWDAGGNHGTVSDYGGGGTVLTSTDPDGVSVSYNSATGVFTDSLLGE